MKYLLISLLFISCEKKESGYCYKCYVYGYSNGTNTFDVVIDTCSTVPLRSVIEYPGVQGNDIPLNCVLK